MKVSKSFAWSSAHLLPNHNGKCARLHGHNYLAEIMIDTADIPDRREDRSSEGMVLDFYVLAELVGPGLIDLWDHRFIAAGDEWPWDAGHLVVPDEFVRLGVRTTAENLAAILAEEVRDRLFNRGFSCRYVTARVWETPKAFGESSTPGSTLWLNTQAAMIGMMEFRTAKLDHLVAAPKGDARE